MIERTIHWLPKPEKHDYAAAESYLSLTLGKKEAQRIMAKLRKAKPARFKAKDIVRAAGLTVLSESNAHVRHNLKKIHDGKSLSPILLVRHEGRLLVADGLHRTCSVYGYHEDDWVPCLIV